MSETENTSKSTIRKRPLSPHLQVYRPQITSTLSIMHRMSGVFLLLGSFAFVAWLVSMAYGEEQFNIVMTHTTSWYGKLFLFGWSVAFYYHMCNGIRHLFWDVGLGFEIKTVRKSGIAALVAATALTAYTWLTILGGQ